MLVMALDVGSSSTRALCVDERGDIVPGVEGRIAYEPVTTPAGAAELDADRLVDAVATAVDACLTALGSRAGEIGAVGASVFWHSLLALDRRGHPLTPLMTWADTRSAPAAAELRNRLDARAVHARTGAPLHSTFLPAKLRWLRSVEPAIFRSARTWCGFAEYLSLILTGQARASVSMASGTGLLDQDTCSWDPELLAVCELEPERLPIIDDASHPGLIGRFAARWPALTHVSWLPAWGDGACSNFGSDCTGPDRIALNVGTSAAMRLVTTEVSALPPGLWRYRVDQRRRLVGGATSEGGNVLAWCRRSLAVPAADGELDAAVNRLGPGAGGLTALPFLAGERSPGWRAEARAALTGLALATGPVEITRSLLEAVACRLALVYEQLAPLAIPGHSVVASGGALTRFPSWAGMIADTLGVPILLAEESEASTRGAALLTFEALGVPVPERAPRGGVFSPDGAAHGRYRELMQRQARLYDRVVPLSGTSTPAPTEPLDNP
jgi:gluconokinase